MQDRRTIRESRVRYGDTLDKAETAAFYEEMLAELKAQQSAVAS
jgi:hypothetical protein